MNNNKNNIIMYMNNILKNCMHFFILITFITWIYKYQKGFYNKLTNFIAMKLSGIKNINTTVQLD